MRQWHGICAYLIAAFASAVVAHSAPGSGRRILQETEFKSSSGDYVFRVTPQSVSAYRPGYCKGELYRVKGGQRELIWSRHLINDRAVHRAVVSDSGQYVVTLDDWDEDGKLPIVIYGGEGSLHTIHTLASLGLDKDYEHIMPTTAGRHWKEHGLFFFGPDEKTFYIRLRWGQMLLIEMHLGNVMDEEWFKKHREWAIKDAEWEAIKKYGNDRSRELAVELLRSDDPHDQTAAAMAAGQLKVMKAAPGLKALLDSNEAFLRRAGDDPWQRVYYVRKAAIDALEAIGETVEDVVVEENAEMPCSP